MITKRQYQILSFYLTRALFFGLGITKIINLARNDSWISGILGTIIGLGVISLIYYLKENKKSFNSFLPKIFLLLLAIFCLHDVLLSLITMMSSFLLPLTPTIIIAIVVVITIIYGNYKNATSFSKVAQILLPISLIIFSFKLISSLAITDYNNFLPFFYGHKLGIFKASLVYALLSSAPSLLLLNIDNETMNYRQSILGYLIGSLTIILTLISINGVLGPTLANIMRFPEYMTLKKLRIENFVENIENILTFTWLFDLIILGFVSAYNLKKITKSFIKEKKKLSTIVYLTIIGIVTLVAVYIFNEHYNLALNLYQIEAFIIAGLVILVILFSLIMNWIKKSYSSE